MTNTHELRNAEQELKVYSRETPRTLKRLLSKKKNNNDDTRCFFLFLRPSALICVKDFSLRWTWWRVTQDLRRICVRVRPLSFLLFRHVSFKLHIVSFHVRNRLLGRRVYIQNQIYIYGKEIFLKKLFNQTREGDWGQLPKPLSEFSRCRTWTCVASRSFTMLNLFLNSKL